MNCFNLFATDFKFHCFSGIDVAFLNESVSRNDNEQLPLGVVPIQTLCDAGFADVGAI